jgi:hypothetical protein
LTFADPELPEFSDPVPTATGFTTSITNVDSAYRYSATATAGRVSIGVATLGTIPVTVTGLAPGTSATVRVTGSRRGFGPVSSQLIGDSNPLPLPVVEPVTDLGTSFTLRVSNFNPAYRYSAAVVSGTGRASVGRRASGSNLPITVTRALPGADVTIRVTVSLGKGSSESVTFVRSAN